MARAASHCAAVIGRRLSVCLVMKWKNPARERSDQRRRRQAQFFDDSDNLPKHRHGVKEFFPRFAIGAKRPCQSILFDTKGLNTEIDPKLRNVVKQSGVEDLASFSNYPADIKVQPAIGIA